MSNIALFDTIDLSLPSGAMTWSNTIVGALRQSGHHVGRFRYDKFRDNPGVIRIPDHPKDGALMMSGYDVILINDPAFYAEDAIARNRGREPRYLELLNHVTKPVITMLHARLEHYGSHIRLREIIEHKNTTHLMMSDKRDLCDLQVDKPVLEVPYLPFLAFDDKVKKELMSRALMPGAFMSARLARSKNQMPLFLIAANDFIDLNVEFFGTSFLGAPVTIPQSYWKKCVQHWGCTPMEPLGGPLKMDTWQVRSPGGNYISYRGPYADVRDAFMNARMRVHVNLTLERNMLEYASIEAIAAGHPIVVNTTMIEDHDYDRLGILPADGLNYGEIARAILEANDQDPKLVLKAAEKNLMLHDAKLYVKRMLDFVA